MRKSFFITGGAGFIGSNFVQIAMDLGHDVVILDALTYAGHRENLTSIQGSGKLVFINGDIRNAVQVEQILNEYHPSIVVNFAAESHVDRSITHPSEFIETNVLGVFNMLHQSRLYFEKLSPSDQVGFRFVQVSTDEVYGSLGDTGYFSEATPYAPNSPYSASKAAGDHLARAWFHTYHFPVITTNCSNNYGPKQFPEKLIPHMISCALQEKTLPVYGKGQNIRDWIHVHDHTRGVLLAAEKGKPGETYCFGGKSERTNLDVVKQICKEMDQQAPRSDGRSHTEQISFVEDRKGHDWRYAIDDSKAEKDLGFTREFKNFEEGLSATVSWYLNHREWIAAVLKPK
jgi:dTDP-glucose 4,6-dehydratase